MADPWGAPGRDGDAPIEAEGLGPAFAADADPLGVAKALVADLQKHPGGYFACGVGYLGFTLALVTVLMGVLGVGTLPGIVFEDETLLVVGSVIGFVAYFALAIGMSLFLIPLMQASAIRAFDAHLRGGPTVDFGSSFRIRGLPGGAGRLVAFQLLSQLLILIGIFLLYLPGIVAAFVTIVALPILVLEPEVSAVDALRLGWAAIRKQPGWHVAVWLVGFGVLLVTEFTIVGLLVMWPILVAYQVIAYRKAFGPDGARALLDGAAG